MLQHPPALRHMACNFDRVPRHISYNEGEGSVAGVGVAVGDGGSQGSPDTRL